MNTKTKNPAERPSIAGTILHFDEVKFRQAKERAQGILPLFNTLISNYKHLELEEPFDQETLQRFFSSAGPKKELQKFNEILSKDLESFTSPVTKANLVQKADEFASSIYETIRTIKENMASFSPPVSSYSLSINDFKIENEQASVTTESMERHYTTYVTEKQAEVYEQLQKFADSHNALIDYFKEEGFQIGGSPLPEHFARAGNTVIAAFFEKEVIEKANSIGQCDRTSAYLVVKKDTIASAAFN